MSRAQQIIDKVVERMRLIAVANGFQTDLGANVDDWRVNWDDEELPALSVCDLTTAHELANDQPTATRQINRMKLQLRIFVKSGTRAADLRKMREDVFQAIKQDLRWNTLALWTIPRESGMILPEDAFEIAGAAVEIEIAYISDNFTS